jgi:hypothetical protein
MTTIRNEHRLLCILGTEGGIVHVLLTSFPRLSNVLKRKQCDNVNWIHLTQAVAGSYEHCDEHSDSMKGDEYLD